MDEDAGVDASRTPSASGEPDGEIDPFVSRDAEARDWDAGIPFDAAPDGDSQTQLDAAPQTDAVVALDAARDEPGPKPPVMVGGAFVYPHPALPGMPGWESTLVPEIDGYVLSRSIEQLAGLEVRRGGVTLFQRSRAEIQAATPTPGLRRQDAKMHWLYTFWWWAYSVAQPSASPGADAVRIGSALARYFVGVQALDVGPECSTPLAYARAQVVAGVPGDASPVAQFAVALGRSEAAIQTADPFKRCFTTLRPVGAISQVLVRIDLPEDLTQPVSDSDVWTTDGSGQRLRVGVPVPPPGSRHGDDVQLDAYALASSMERLSSLEVLHDGAPLVQLDRARLQQGVPRAGAPHLSELELRQAWLETITGWLPGGRPSAYLDGVRIAVALTTQLVGVSEVVLGSTGYPTSHTGSFAVIQAGVPGDDAAARLSAALAAFDAESAQGASGGSFYITNILPQAVPGTVREVPVSIDLPAHITDQVGDTDMWLSTQGRGVARAGVPAPASSPLHRGRATR